MKLIVGLGNPGTQYTCSRHNVGYRSTNYLARKWQIQLSERRKTAVLGTGVVFGQEVILGKPRTFMNCSGQGVGYLMTRFHGSPSDLVIIYDDMDLPLGSIRVRATGGSAGHNGVESIIAALGYQNFPRVRIGIGKPGDHENAINHVLAPFTVEEDKVVGSVIKRLGDLMECLLRDGIDKTMNYFND